MLTALLLAAALAAPGDPAPSVAGTEAVVVRVYDAARMPTSELKEALKVGSSLLGAVGIHLTWKVCRDAHPDDSDADDCSVPPGARELCVRLAKGTAAPPSAVLGFANVPGILGTAWVDRIEETAQRTKRTTALLLGAVMAHELVHLLLGSDNHARLGMMQAAWTDSDIRLGRIWQIKLTADQRQAIATGLREWPEAASAAAPITPAPRP